MVEYKDFTVEEIYNALEKNGFEHLRKQWTAQDLDGVMTGGCVLAQAAMNLGVVPTGSTRSLADSLDGFDVSNTSKYYTGEGVGSTIIHWNDRQVINYKTGQMEYALKTYKQVARMAYALMKPYFDKTITLRLRDWSFKKLDGTFVKDGVIVES